MFRYEKLSKQEDEEEEEGHISRGRREDKTIMRSSMSGSGAVRLVWNHMNSILACLVLVGLALQSVQLRQLNHEFKTELSMLKDTQKLQKLSENTSNAHVLLEVRAL